MKRQLPARKDTSQRLAATADENQCTAFNAAFRELGFDWRWTPETYSRLAPIADERERIRIYLETEQPHVLSTYDPDFLIDAIQSAKARCHEALFGADDEDAAAAPRRKANGGDGF